MKRKGFSTLFVLIISAVSLPLLGFAWQSLFVQAKLNANRLDMIQGQLNLEGETNRLIYEESGINDKILDILKKKSDEIFMKDKKFDLSIDSEIFTNPLAEISFVDDKNSRPQFKLRLSGDYKGFNFNKTMFGAICLDEVDQCDNGLVYLQGKSIDYINRIEDLFLQIPDSLDNNYLPSKHTYYRPLCKSNLTIKTTPYTNSELYLDHKESPCIKISDNGIILIVKYDGFNRNNLLIDSSNSPNFTTKLSGIIYLENGDITFRGKCNFQGLIFIKDGEIKSEGTGPSKIMGKVILNSFKDPRDSVDIEYDLKTYLKYAKYLPSLLDPHILKE